MGITSKSTSNKFPKSERLTNKKLIGELFDKGSSFHVHPLKVLYLESPSESNQVLITVPKKIFKRAVDRNLIKRRIREAYRTNKHKRIGDTYLLIGYIYIGKEIAEYKTIERKLIETLDRLNAKC